MLPNKNLNRLINPHKSHVYLHIVFYLNTCCLTNSLIDYDRYCLITKQSLASANSIFYVFSALRKFSNNFRLANINLLRSRGGVFTELLGLT